MNESKIEATDRLRREGRWAEASQFKDETIKRLRAEGRKKEANEVAWAEMIAAFPPLETKPAASVFLDISSEDPDLIRRLATVKPDWDRDVMWAYQVFPAPTVQLSLAPSLSAW